MNKSVLDQARYYVAKGFSVIPLRPLGKEATIKWKEFQNRHPTDEELIEWFGNGSTNNIGIVTGRISNIAVLDYDSDKAVEYSSANNFPATPLVRTGKGYHAYYRYRKGIRNFQKRNDLPDIDLRGDGGYVVAPPSVHKSGKQYEWMPGKGIEDLPFAELPEIVISQKPAGNTPMKDLYKGVNAGQRNDALARLTGSWVKDRLSLDDCLQNADIWNTKNEPPLPNMEIERTVKSIFEKHHREKKKGAISNNGDKNVSPGDSAYFYGDDGYLCRWRQTKDGMVPVRLANFKASIIEEITEDDGLELTHYYGIVGKTRNVQLPKIEVSANSFPTLNWISKWGNQAILEPGQAIRDYVRHSIQHTSNCSANKITCYTHTGWRKIQDGNWVYLSGGGAVGNDKTHVKLSNELVRYSLPTTVDNEIEAIKASLSFLDIGEREITLPLFAFLYLSPMTTILNPMPNFSGYLYGETGNLKTTVAITMLSHFGHFDSIHGLSNFDDTANALTKRAFTLKDTLLVLDDFHPSNRKTDSQQMENIAQRVIRACSNRTSRHRLNSDTTEKGAYEPRCMLLITGEELVSLQSTLARLMVIEISKGDINPNKLSQIQSNAGLLPQAMHSYIAWLRDRLDTIRESFQQKLYELRDKATNDGFHRKIPEQIAFLQFALDIAIAWMVDKGVLSKTSSLSLSEEGWNIFLNLSQKQSQRIEREDPIRRFAEIFHTLITKGKVKLEHKTDSGWENDIGSGAGELIGYYDENYCYLLPTALWHSLQTYCLAEGSHFSFSRQTLYRTLANRGYIVTKGNQHVIPEWIKGRTVRVLKIIGSSMPEFNVRGVRDA
jgi:hypothetical protein